MEATNNYYLPLLSFLKEHGIFVTVINPLVIKKYVNMTLRNGNTDKLAAIKIANYGLDYWFHFEVGGLFLQIVAADTHIS